VPAAPVVVPGFFNGPLIWERACPKAIAQTNRLILDKIAKSRATRAVTRPIREP
jgi:hypothetical protein